ncbi:ARSK [Symbiodinium natans]|uniref:ARSK protein n=1 Tax=Symbiodinium natans TaxID=878477 RepID=A0A812V2Z2_9DINO|nr:ARSK [Symbiodinium natans]
MWLSARTCLIIAACSVVLDAAEQRQRHERPHILFLMVDEMDGRLLDDETPQFKPPLPNLRALMKNGTYFPNTYSNSPLCVPARTSMVTGRYNSDIKIWDNFVGIANVNGDDTQIDQRCLTAYSRRECLEFAASQNINGTFFDVLADQGYNLTLWGKVHAGGGVERFSRHIFNDPFTGTGLVRESAKAWTRSTGVASKLQDPTDWLQRPIDVPKPAENFFDYPTADECTRLLEQGLFKSSTPQFLYCSFAVPHPPYQTNSTYWNAVGPLGKHAMPTLVPRDKLHPADEYAVRSKQFWNLDNCKPEHIEHFRRVYFAMCVEADHLVGRILTAFWENVDPDDAFVIFVSDHGELNLEHRQWQKSSMKEASARIPLIVSGPGMPKGRRVQSLASLNDIYPTLLDIAGAGSRVPADKLAGESVLPIARWDHRKKNYVVSEYYDTFSRTGTFMVRQGQQKLIVHAPLENGVRWPAQLFNIATDPWELTDLAAELPSEVSRLEALLRREFDLEAVDAQKKAYDHKMFISYVYRRYSGPAGCQKAMRVAFPGFDEEDAKLVEKWLGKPCCKVLDGRVQRKAKFHTLACPSKTGQKVPSS